MRYYHEYRLRNMIILYEHRIYPKNMKKDYCRDNQLKHIYFEHKSSTHTKEIIY